MQPKKENPDGAFTQDRCEQLAKHIVQSGDTVRDTAKIFGLSKSTVHKDVTEKLSHINPSLFGAVREVLDVNKSVRHLRGGEATKRRYQQLKQKNAEI